MAVRFVKAMTRAKLTHTNMHGIVWLNRRVERKSVAYTWLDRQGVSDRDTHTLSETWGKWQKDRQLHKHAPEMDDAFKVMRAYTHAHAHAQVGVAKWSWKGQSGSGKSLSGRSSQGLWKCHKHTHSGAHTHMHRVKMDGSHVHLHQVTSILPTLPPLLLHSPPCSLHPSPPTFLLLSFLTAVFITFLYYCFPSMIEIERASINYYEG